MTKGVKVTEKLYGAWTIYLTDTINIILNLLNVLVYLRCYHGRLFRPDLYHSQYSKNFRELPRT